MPHLAIWPSLLYYLVDTTYPFALDRFIVQVSNSLGLRINMLTILVYRPSPESLTIELAVSKHPTSVPCILYRDFWFCHSPSVVPCILYRDPLILLFGTGCPLYHIQGPLNFAVCHWSPVIPCIPYRDFSTCGSFDGAQSFTVIAMPGMLILSFV